MTLFGRDVLLVALSFHDARTLADRPHRWGLRCRVAVDMRARS